MRFLRQSFFGTFLTALTLGLLVYAAHLVTGAIQHRLANERPAPPPRERVFTVNVLPAVLTTERPVIESFGEIRSRRTLELRAAAGGRVIELASEFETGGSVKSGQLLVQIDPSDAQTALSRVEVDLADAEAELRDAERNISLARDDEVAAQRQVELREQALKRQEDLAERGVGTTAAVEVAELSLAAARQTVVSRRQAVAQAEARIDLARTRLDRMRIASEEAQRRLDDTTLLAPFDGTLADVNIVEGYLVNPNERLAELIDPDALEVAFRLSTSQFARLLDPQNDLIPADIAVTLDVAGVDLTARGRIDRASAAAGAGQTGRLVFAHLDSARGFRPGDFVTVRISEPPLDQVVRLPASAYDTSSGTVLVLGEENRLESLPVELVRQQRDDVLVRGEGLPGQEVVTSRSPLLGAGIAVRPLRRGGAAEAEADAAEEMVELTEERRARLVAFIEGNNRMPAEAKARVLARLAEPRVPVRIVERIESRMGG